MDYNEFMKKYILILTISTLLIFTTSSSYAYTVVGGMKCGQLLSYDRDDNKGVKNHIISWFKGYLTEKNRANAIDAATYDVEKSDISNVPDDDSIYYYFVKYCRDNPINHTLDAADALWLKLLGY